LVPQGAADFWWKCYTVITNALAVVTIALTIGSETTRIYFVDEYDAHLANKFMDS